jgi:hypothetical protein
MMEVTKAEVITEKLAGDMGLPYGTPMLVSIFNAPTGVKWSRRYF